MKAEARGRRRRPDSERLVTLQKDSMKSSLALTFHKRTFVRKK